jgi:hypothetical protein
MAAQGSSPPSAQPPPVPPGLDPVLARYLQAHALWCRHGFAAKLNSNSALPGVMLQANDAVPGATPKTFHIQVNSAGAVVTTPITAGIGKP